VRPGVSVPRCRRFSRSPGPRRRPGGDRRAWGDQSGSLSPWQDPPFRTPTTSASWTPPPGSSSALSRPAAIPTPWRSFRSRSEPALCAGTASEFNLLERPPPFPGKVIQVRKQRSYFPVGEAWLRRRIVATPTRKQAGERRRRRGPRGDWPSDNDCGFSLVLRVCQGYLRGRNHPRPVRAPAALVGSPHMVHHPLGVHPLSPDMAKDGGGGKVVRGGRLPEFPLDFPSGR